MVQASCHCGRVRLTLRAAPEEITSCNCSICRRYGALWAYYPPAHVELVAGAGETDGYMWDERSIAFHRCRECGCVTHWSPNDGRNRMGVNARMLPPELVAAARVRRLDGAVTEAYLD